MHKVAIIVPFEFYKILKRLGIKNLKFKITLLLNTF